MPLHWSALRPLVLILVVVSLESNVRASLLQARDGIHAHRHSHAPPLLDLNETEVTMYHAPTPESYYTIDWEGAGQGTRYPGLVITHVILMSLAFFIALPISIALRSVKHAGRTFAVMAFYALCALGCASSALYRKLTPNMYEGPSFSLFSCSFRVLKLFPGSVHGTHGYLVLLLAISLSAIDILSLFRRVFMFWSSSERFAIKTFWRSTILGRDQEQRDPGSEYTGLVSEDLEEFEESRLNLSSTRESTDLSPRDQYGDHTAQWVNDVQQQPPHRFHRHHSRQPSTASERTLLGIPSPSTRSWDKIQDTKGVSFVRRFIHASYAVVERFLVFAGLAQLLTGIVIYTGGCRQNYVNGCLAHLIKGGIFWSYGLFSFARFLGTFSELGWAWNRSPNGKAVSGEFVECLVIFTYGATNMWMERFGANAGDPFTAKQIQHISIAVMFCFAGLIGMGIESKRIRSWLASSTFATIRSERLEADAVAEPPSYIASFNPFPALVIGVTGAAMAAHAQTYVFQVQMHELWGNLLVAFSVLRFLTYFLLWLNPPRSILPSRPPTEALGSFFLACGGLVFMFSTEEVTIAAMRRGRDDVMMFFNVAVATTCFAFCWTLATVGFKGWLKSRMLPAVSYHRSA